MVDQVLCLVYTGSLRRWHGDELVTGRTGGGFIDGKIEDRGLY